MGECGLDLCAQVDNVCEHRLGTHMYERDWICVYVCNGLDLCACVYL